MKIFLLLLLVGIVIAIFLYKIVLQVQLIFDSDEQDMHITLFWLDSIMKAFITVENSKFKLKLYLFNKLILEKNLKGSQKSQFKGFNILQLTNPKDVRVDVSYGFRDPFSTGIACGAISFASQFINIDYMNQIPNFTTDNDYIYLDASAKVNLGPTFIRMIKS